MTTSTYLWDQGAFERIADDPRVPLRVADSWRQVDGHVRGFALHRERFVAAVSRVAGLDATAFVEAAREHVPAGEWFPRVRLVGDALLLDVRPGPPRRPRVTVRVLPPGDPRTMPRVKGPDLALCGRLIAAAGDVGADEVLLRSDDGMVLEAGYASLVWWEGDDLLVPDRRLPLLPSVTRCLVEDLARARGIRVREVTARIADLDGREAWLLNAYQGLRLVTEWRHGPITAGAGERFEAWRSALDGR